MPTNSAIFSRTIPDATRFMIHQLNPDVHPEYLFKGNPEWRKRVMLTALNLLPHLERSFPLYYYEVMSGTQTSCFSPTHYVNISPSQSLKREACFAHRSQKPDEFYPDHDAMNRFRGMEYGCRFAEAFVRHNQDQPATGALL